MSLTDIESTLLGGFLFYESNESMSHESMSHESSYESGQRFCLEPFQDGGEAWIRRP